MVAIGVGAFQCGSCWLNETPLQLAEPYLGNTPNDK